MGDICEKIRELLPELIDAGLSPERAVELEQHRSQCPACNEYFEALEADDKLMCEFALAMQPNLTRLENIAVDDLSRRRPGVTTPTVSIGAKILSDRVVQIAAAVLVVATILVVVALFGGSGAKQDGALGPPGGPEPVASESPAEVEQDTEALAESELLAIRRMIAASDVAGVMAMLSDGQPQSKIMAANYLATTGDARLIGVLAQLAAEWQGEAARNPFAAAIVQIMTTLQEQEQKSEAGDDEEDAAVAETTTVSSGQGVACKGVVVDERGQAIGDARVLLYHNRNPWGLGNRTLEETTSTADGAFVCRQRLEFSPVEQLSYTQQADMPVAGHSEYVLMATHPDYAFGWRNIRQASQQDEYRIVLTQPTSRSRGIIVTDRDGNPLAGVRIWLHNAGESKSPKAVFRDDLILATDAGFVGATTDAAGRAVLKNLPDTYCSFSTTLKGYAEAGISPTERVTRIRLRRGAGVSGWVLVQGSVPVVGAIVSLKPNWMQNHFLAVSDDNGYFSFEDLPAKGWEPRDDSQGASGSYTATIRHERCVAQPAEFILLPGQSLDEFLIEAYNEATLVECQVVEFGTNVPVAGARIQGWNKIGSFSGYSDSEGIFAVSVLPGLVELSFHSPPKGVYVLDERMPDESSLGFEASGRKMSVTIKTPPIAGSLRNVSGIVFGPDGMAQGDSETIVYARAGGIKTSFTTSGAVRSVWVDGDGRFELKEVPAGRRLYLYVVTKDRALAATGVYEIPDDPDWSDYLGINLDATQTASVVVSDENGNVVPGAEFRIDPIIEGERIRSVDIAGRTDENGMLELDGIIPGLEYHLLAIAPKTNEEPPLEATGGMLTLKMVLVTPEPQ